VALEIVKALDAIFANWRGFNAWVLSQKMKFCFLFGVVSFWSLIFTFGYYFG